MSESVRNSDVPNMLDNQQLFANTKKMAGLITEELKSRGYEPRDLSDAQLRKVIEKAPKTANRLEQITDNVLRPGDEGPPLLIKDFPIGELEMFIENMQEGRSISDKDLMNFLKTRAQEGRSISDKDLDNLRKVLGMQAGGETTDRIAELTENVLRPKPMTKEEAMAEAEKMRFLDALEERSPSSGGIEELLMSMATFTPVGRGVQGAKQVANAPKFLKDLYDRRSLYMQMADASMRSLKSIMGPSKGKTNSDDLFTRIGADDFDLVQRQKVMDTAYKASRRKDELMNIERQIKSAEKALENANLAPSNMIFGPLNKTSERLRKVDAAEEVGKRFMAKSKLSTGGLIDALKNIRNK